MIRKRRGKRCGFGTVRRGAGQRVRERVFSGPVGAPDGRARIFRRCRRSRPISPNVLDDMRSGSDQSSRGRYNGNRPFQPPQRTPQRNQTFDSHGPDVRIRGSAQQIFERYVALAREAATAGDRVAAENLYQHAEHYFRVDNASREGGPQAAPRPSTPTDFSTTEPEQQANETNDPQPGFGDDRPGFI
jgi:hypothetical protein